MADVIASLLLELLDECGVMRDDNDSATTTTTATSHKTARHQDMALTSWEMVWLLAKHDPGHFDTGTEKHVKNQALTGCKGLGGVTLCLCQTSSLTDIIGNRKCGNGGVAMHPDCMDEGARHMN